MILPVNVFPSSYIMNLFITQVNLFSFYENTLHYNKMVFPDTGGSHAPALCGRVLGPCGRVERTAGCGQRARAPGPAAARPRLLPTTPGRTAHARAAAAHTATV